MTSEVSISYYEERSTAPCPTSDEYTPLVPGLFLNIQFNIMPLLHLRIPGGFFHSDFQAMILYAFFLRPCLPSRFDDRSNNI